MLAMVSSIKLDLFIIKIENIVKTLHKHNTLFVHQRVSQSYYMQKEAELKILKEQLEASQNLLEATQSRVNEHYKNLFIQWQKDARWLNQYLAKIRRLENISS